MRQAFLTDPEGKRYNLTVLLKENDGDISVGRVGYGNIIEVTEGRENVRTSMVSRNHATICYHKDMGFYIKDHSTHGTWINDTKILGEIGFLINGAKILFALTGPFSYEEVLGD
jgi:pSer/pThr/pTyr-binding forkhead associated (FHA) protein